MVSFILSLNNGSLLHDLGVMLIALFEIPRDQDERKILSTTSLNIFVACEAMVFAISVGFEHRILQIIYIHVISSYFA